LLGSPTNGPRQSWTPALPFPSSLRRAHDIASIWLGNAILIEASLSFLGVGTQPPTPSWGLMLSSTGRAFMEQAPWLAIFPGLAISLAVFGFNLFGDTLRDAWDPKLRRQG
jgi:peptide/nickel transport system permease protein